MFRQDKLNTYNALDTPVFRQGKLNTYNTLDRPVFRQGKDVRVSLKGEAVRWGQKRIVYSENKPDISE